MVLEETKYKMIFSIFTDTSYNHPTTSNILIYNNFYVNKPLYYTLYDNTILPITASMFFTNNFCNNISKICTVWDLQQYLQNIQSTYNINYNLNPVCNETFHSSSLTTLINSTEESHTNPDAA